jgi:hypothetical protein
MPPISFCSQVAVLLACRDGSLRSCGVGALSVFQTLALAWTLLVPEQHSRSDLLTVEQRSLLELQIQAVHSEVPFLDSRSR